MQTITNDPNKIINLKKKVYKLLFKKSLKADVFISTKYIKE